MSSSWSNHRVLARKFTASTSFIFYICTHWSIWSKSMSDTFLNFYPVTCSYSDSKPGRQVEKINFKHCITEQESRVFHRRLFSQPLDLVPWNFSFWETCIQGTPPFRDTKFGRRKTSTKSLYLLPLLMGHLYSWEMDTT